MLFGLESMFAIAREKGKIKKVYGEKSYMVARCRREERLAIELAPEASGS